MIRDDRCRLGPESKLRGSDAASPEAWFACRMGLTCMAAGVPSGRSAAQGWPPETKKNKKNKKTKTDIHAQRIIMQDMTSQNARKGIGRSRRGRGRKWRAAGKRKRKGRKDEGTTYHVGPERRDRRRRQLRRRMSELTGRIEREKMRLGEENQV